MLIKVLISVKQTGSDLFSQTSDRRTSFSLKMFIKRFFLKYSIYSTAFVLKKIGIKDSLFYLFFINFVISIYIKYIWVKKTNKTLLGRHLFIPQPYNK